MTGASGYDSMVALTRVRAGWLSDPVTARPFDTDGNDPNLLDCEVVTDRRRSLGG